MAWNIEHHSSGVDMEWVTIDHIGEHAGEKVELRGWVANRRSSGKVQFLMLRDGSGVIQCVAVKNQVSPEAFDVLSKIPYESAVVVQGEVREDKRSPIGFELSLEHLGVVSEAEPYPIAKKDHGVGFLMC